jgi:hypothetical protein
MEKNLGSYLCGPVQFELTGSFDHFYLCHCRYCRKDTGSAHAATLFSSNGVLKWMSGESFVTTFRLSGTRHARSFCRMCWSGLPHASKDGVVVPAGCLDTVPRKRPDAHLSMQSRAAWDDGFAGLPAFEALPSLESET